MKLRHKNLKKFLKTQKLKLNLQLVSVLILISIFIFFLIFRVHTDFNGVYQTLYGQYIEGKNFRYDYPMHGDEWTHLAQAVYIMDSKSLGFVNPYLQGKPFHRDLESGFHIFIAEHFLMTRVDTVTGYRFLPALFAVISSLFVFLFMRKITNDYIGLLSMLFFSTLKSNINMMGTWFFIPFTMSFFILFLFMYFLLDVKSKRNYREFIILIYLILMSIVIYPFIAVLLVGISVMYYGLSLNFSNQKIFWPLILSIVVFFFLLLNDLPFLEKFVFLSSWTLGTMGTVTYNIIPLTGPLNVLFAALGVFYVFKRKINIIVLIMPVLFLINILIHQFFGFTILIGYQRCVYYFMLSIVPLSAVGLYYILKLIRKYLSKIKDIKKYSAVIVLIIVFLVFAFSFRNYYNIVEQKNVADKASINLVPLIFVDEAGYDAIKFVDENYEEGIVVMANNLLSFGIYPISKNHVVSIQSANLGTGKWRAKKYFEFVNTNCWNKFRILHDFNVTAIITKQTIPCKKSDFIEYNNRTYYQNIKLTFYKNIGYYIYEFENNFME